MPNETLTFILEARDLATNTSRKVRAEMTGLGGAVGGLRQQFTVGVAAGNLLATGIQRVGAAITDSVGEAVDFQTQMLNVNSITKASTGELANMSQQVIDLSKTLPQSASSLASGLYDIASSGFQGAEGMEVLESAARAASAGLTTTDVSAAGLTAVLNAYQLSADQAAHISDIMFQTVNLGVVTFEELSSEIGKTTALSAPLGVSFEEVSAALSLMTRKGIDAANATTQINAIMANLLKPSQQAIKLAEQLGLGWDAEALKARGLSGVLADLVAKTGGNHQQMATLLGDQRAIRGAFVLAADGGAELNAEIAKMEDAAGATSSALSEQEKGLAFQLAVAGNKLQAMVTTVVLDAAPAITELVHLFGDLIGVLGKAGEAMGFMDKVFGDVHGTFMDWNVDIDPGKWAVAIHEFVDSSVRDLANLPPATDQIDESIKGVADSMSTTWAGAWQEMGAIPYQTYSTAIVTPIARAGREAVTAYSLTKEEITALAERTPSDIAVAILSGKVDINAIRERMREIIKNPVSDAKSEAANAALLISPAIAKGLASNSTQVKAEMLAEVVEPTLNSLLTLNPKVFQEGAKLPPAIARAVRQTGPQAVQAMRDLVGDQKVPLGQLSKIAHEMGLEGIAGLIAGMAAKQKAARNKASEIGDDVIAALDFDASAAGSSIIGTWIAGMVSRLIDEIPTVNNAAYRFAAGTLGASLPTSGPFAHPERGAISIVDRWTETMAARLGDGIRSIQGSMPSLSTGSLAMAAPTGGYAGATTGGIEVHFHTAVPPTPAQGAELARAVGPELVRWMRGTRVIGG